LGCPAKQKAPIDGAVGGMKGKALPKPIHALYSGVNALGSAFCNCAFKLLVQLVARQELRLELLVWIARLVQPELVFLRPCELCLIVKRTTGFNGTAYFIGKLLGMLEGFALIVFVDEVLNKSTVFPDIIGVSIEGEFDWRHSLRGFD
jgi:hypothetical protein